MARYLCVNAPTYFSLTSLAQFLADGWYFLASAGTWLHRAAVGQFLQDRECSVVQVEVFPKTGVSLSGWFSH